MAATYARFGSFVLFKEVYADDLGHVWRAGEVSGTTVGRTVWLRILDSAGLPAAQIAASFATARLVGESVRSANLPSEPVFVEVGGVPALGFEYQPGQPLNRVLARARDEAFPVPPDNALLVVEKIALAVSAGMALEVGGVSLVHRFLHPGLIYLSYDGEASVTGFGVGEPLLGALESPGVVAGSRPYLAPEALANRIGSKPADVYSLGAILFHLLTGTALPAAPEDRSAALTAAHLAYDGEPLSGEIAAILARALAPSPRDRFSSAAGFRTELEQLIYGGTYSPTTFNLALFMDRLFRSEIEADELLCAAELEVEVAPIPPPEAVATPVAVADREKPGGRGRRWAAVGGAVAVVAILGGVFWLNWGPSSRLPPPEPTPTAEDIEARRQAQEERLKTMTQEMVQQMMAEREQEIRQELVSRQTRIEELQRRLLESERRAGKSAASSGRDASTREKLKREIEAEEEAQRIQEERLAAEQTKVPQEAAEQAGAETAPVAAATGGDPAAEPVAATETVTAAPAPTPSPDKPTPSPAEVKPPPVKPTAAAARSAVRPGAFVPPEETDTLPVVLKSQGVTWPKVATRSTRSGVVIIRATVNASGGVDEVTLLRADDSGFGIPEAALEAVRKYRFKPGTKDGVAITTHAVVTKRYDFSGR